MWSKRNIWLHYLVVPTTDQSSPRQKHPPWEGVELSPEKVKAGWPFWIATFLSLPFHILKTSDSSYVSYVNLAAQTFFLVYSMSRTSWKLKPGVVLTKHERMVFLHHLDRLLVLGRVIAVFLSVVQKFAEGLSDRFSSLEHPCVFIHGWYGSFHKTFTPWFAMSLCVNN